MRALDSRRLGFAVVLLGLFSLNVGAQPPSTFTRHVKEPRRKDIRLGAGVNRAEPLLDLFTKPMISDTESNILVSGSQAQLNAFDSDDISSSDRTLKWVLEMDYKNVGLTLGINLSGEHRTKEERRRRCLTLCAWKDFTLSFKDMTKLTLEPELNALLRGKPSAEALLEIREIYGTDVVTAVTKRCCVMATCEVDNMSRTDFNKVKSVLTGSYAHLEKAKLEFDRVVEETLKRNTLKFSLTTLGSKEFGDLGQVDWNEVGSLRKALLECAGKLGANGDAGWVVSVECTPVSQFVTPRIRDPFGSETGDLFHDELMKQADLQSSLQRWDESESNVPLHQDVNIELPDRPEWADYDGSTLSAMFRATVAGYRKEVGNTLRSLVEVAQAGSAATVAAVASARQRREAIEADICKVKVQSVAQQRDSQRNLGRLVEATQEPLAVNSVAALNRLIDEGINLNMMDIRYGCSLLYRLAAYGYDEPLENALTRHIRNPRYAPVDVNLHATAGGHTETPLVMASARKFEGEVFEARQLRTIHLLLKAGAKNTEEAATLARQKGNARLAVRLTRLRLGHDSLPPEPWPPGR